MLKNEKIDVNLYNKRYNSSKVEKMTPLHLAIENRNVDFVQLLRQHEYTRISLMAELVASGFMEKKAPIHYAIEMDSDKIIDLLCHHYPQCVNYIYIYLI